MSDYAALSSAASTPTIVKSWLGNKNIVPPQIGECFRSFIAHSQRLILQHYMSFVVVETRFCPVIYRSFPREHAWTIVGHRILDRRNLDRLDVDEFICRIVFRVEDAVRFASTDLDRSEARICQLLDISRCNKSAKIRQILILGTFLTRSKEKQEIQGKPS